MTHGPPPRPRWPTRVGPSGPASAGRTRPVTRPRGAPRTGGDRRALHSMWTREPRGQSLLRPVRLGALPGTGRRVDQRDPQGRRRGRPSSRRSPRRLTRTRVRSSPARRVRPARGQARPERRQPLPAGPGRHDRGRHPDSDIFLDDVTVSRRHVEFHREGGGFSVHDVGSLNGTYVNREPVDVATLAGVTRCRSASSASSTSPAPAPASRPLASGRAGGPTRWAASRRHGPGVLPRP